MIKLSIQVDKANAFVPTLLSQYQARIWISILVDQRNVNTHLHLNMIKKEFSRVNISIELEYSVADFYFLCILHYRYKNTKWLDNRGHFKMQIKQLIFVIS